MEGPGWAAAVACAALLLVVNAAIWGIVSAATDGLGRNALAGIRLPALLRSDEAWSVGHVAARRIMTPLLIGAAAIALLSIPAQSLPVAYVAMIGGSLIVTVAALVIGTIVAVRAARRLQHETRAGTTSR